MYVYSVSYMHVKRCKNVVYLKNNCSQTSVNKRPQFLYVKISKIIAQK